MIPLKDNIPTGKFPFVTVSLILINVVVYLLAIRHGGSLFSGPGTEEVVKYGAIPKVLLHPGLHCAAVVRTATGQQEVLCNDVVLAANQIPTENTLPTWETVFSAMFMHASFLHIAGNMLFLWIFGNNVEDSMGPVKYVGFYILGGIAALALQVVDRPERHCSDARAPQGRSPPCSAATSCSIRGRACSRWSSSSCSSR